MQYSYIITHYAINKIKDSEDIQKMNNITKKLIYRENIKIMRI